MDIYYLEIVSNDVDREMKMLTAAQGVTFGEPVAELGGARIADAPGGGMIAVRAPMHGGEKPVARPYFLTESLDARVEALRELGAEIAVASMPIPGQGTIAIYMVDGIEYGLWQN